MRRSWFSRTCVPMALVALSIAACGGTGAPQVVQSNSASTAPGETTTTADPAASTTAVDTTVADTSTTVLDTTTSTTVTTFFTDVTATTTFADTPPITTPTMYRYGGSGGRASSGGLLTDRPTVPLTD